MALRDDPNSESFGQTPSQTIGPFFHYALPWKGGADLVGQSELGARLDLFPPEHDLLNAGAANGTVKGMQIEIRGTVLDGMGDPIPDAMLEIWQANAAGRYRGAGDDRDHLPLDDAFVGFGRSSTSEQGEYRFRTVLPGRVPGPGNSLQAPHIAVSVMGRGLLKRLVTRIYFERSEGLDDDPILNLVPAERRATLIAKRIATRESPQRAQRSEAGESPQRAERSEAGESPQLAERSEAGTSPQTYRFDIRLQGDGETVFFDI
jgi:protocatechuate 3,4-dioxygenase alpha subunit